MFRIKESIMNVPKTRVLLLGAALILPTTVFADPDGMKGMPTIKDKKTYSVKSADEGKTLQDGRGFGDEEQETRMMNLMMVEGSGYEGMDMSAMKMGGTKAGTGPDKDKQAPQGHHGMDMSGPNMGKMDMGGMKMSHASELASKSSTSTNPLRYDAKLSSNPAKVGANTLEITVTDGDGKPVKGLKLKAMVSMTSMDMGTDEARVRETAPGKYQAKVIFSMQGPWAVKVSSGSKQEKIFEFTAEKTAQ
jgi:hypothetical protein